ncbi:DUF1523 family protein [Jannaschia sp. S6380]|uniref:DUF1523 family protein n=1 Tax=Jannaschia sp. S6380 TaxID=2926408 RepID=UPI001FF54321|nr:DUF1523 family protein [Jannaschia sp. S6380]MCK0169087.1 DUF1523 family protein [Jannaschia sp. S6380]
MRFVKWGLLLAWLAVVAAFLHYTLPQTDIVRVTDTDVVRIDPTPYNRLFYADADVGNAANDSRDVRFINAVNEDRRARVYRNQDTGWGWPPYFKFDSANLQAEANDYDSDVTPEWVALKHYGWRIEFLSIYPNAIGLRPVEGPEVTIVPWFNIIFLTLLLALVWAITVRLLRFRRNRIDPALADAGEAWDDAGEAVARRRRGVRAWLASWAGGSRR